MDDNKWVAYNLESGEIKEDIQIRFNDDIRNAADLLRRKKEVKLMNSADKTYFKFFISKFERVTDLEPQILARLMYLSTYVSYDNNYLKHSNGVKLTKKDISSIMKLSNRSFDAFFKEVKDKGYLIQMEDGFILNKKIVHRGYNDNRPLDKNEHYNKIYIQAMRKMYLSTNTRQHKFLGYVFQMLPYVNIYHNILCYNPYESNIDDIEPMNMIRFCESIGINTNDVTKFRKNTEKILFNFCGKEQHFLCFILPVEAENKNQGMIMVNPNVLCSRSIIERQALIESFFGHELSERIRETNRKIRQRRKEQRMIEASATEIKDKNLLSKHI